MVIVVANNKLQYKRIRLINISNVFWEQQCMV